MRDKKEIYIFAGPNGSGKSTVLKDFKNKKSIPDKYICPDLIVPKDKRNDKNEYLKAMQTCEQERYDCIKHEISFCFETVFSNPEKIDFIKYAQEHGYKVTTIYIVTSDPAINIERVAKRVSEDGHNVPKDKIVSRYYRCMELMDEVVEISDAAYVYDTSDPNYKPKILFAKNNFGTYFHCLDDSWIRKYIHI
ncbi:MAG: zeta toxin family protein [Ruminococcus sp.]|jgi:predicted ABC-type ATPase|nr:zeta toxin family protein [Ruminococcus sp.]